MEDTTNIQRRYKLNLYALMPYNSMPAVERALIWDDSVHFKPAGYVRIGQFVADALLKIIDPPNASTSVPTSAPVSEPTNDQD